MKRMGFIFAFGLLTLVAPIILPSTTRAGSVDFNNQATSSAEVSGYGIDGKAIKTTYGVDHPAKEAFDRFENPHKVEVANHVKASASARISYMPGYIGDRLGFHVSAYADHISGPVEGAVAQAKASFTDHFIAYPNVLGLEIFSSVTAVAFLKVSGEFDATSRDGLASASVRFTNLSDAEHPVTSSEYSSASFESGVINELLTLNAAAAHARTSRFGFELSFDLGATAFASASESPGSYAFSNFGSTFTLLGFEIVDPDGKVIPSTIVSDSGINYNYTPNSVPEPSSLVMLGLGIASLAGIRLFRRVA